jgi:hypothetical protein
MAVNKGKVNFVARDRMQTATHLCRSRAGAFPDVRARDQFVTL